MRHQNQGIGVIVFGAVLLGLASAALAGGTERPDGTVEKQTLLFGFSTDGSPVSSWDKSVLGFCGDVYRYLKDNPQITGYNLQLNPISRADQRFEVFAKSLGKQPGIQCGPSSSTYSRRQKLKPDNGPFEGEFTQIFFTTNAKVLVRKEKIPALYAGEPIKIGVLDSKVLDLETPKNGKSRPINCNRELNPQESTVTSTSVAALFPHAHMLAVADRSEAVECLQEATGKGLDAYAGDGLALEDIRSKNLISDNYSVEPPLGSFLREDYVLVVYNAPGLAAILNKWLDGDQGMRARDELESVRDGSSLTQWLSDLLVWANRGDHLSRFFTGLLLAALLLVCIGVLSAWLLLRRRGNRLSRPSDNSLEKDERRYFSRELHDNVLQMLAAAKRRIELAQKQITRNDNAYEDNLNVSKATLDETIKEVRRISHEIRKEMEDALDALLRDFEERNGINVRKTCSVTLRELPDRTTDMLYRVMQEALMNIERHAQATEVEVSLSKNTRQVRMEIRDNGKGFNPDKLPPQTGIGLKNMAERIEILGGKLRIDSTPGRGTLVWATVPLS